MSSPTTARPCPNCSAPATGRYCSECGAAVADAICTGCRSLHMMMLIVSNPRAMGRLTLSRSGKFWGWLATLVMAFATVIFVIFLLA